MLRAAYDIEAQIVSIHAFRGEGDSSSDNPQEPGRRFQSTPSGGKATQREIDNILLVWVSIHAFRGEGDAAG